MMALTATATRTLRNSVCSILGMVNPTVVEISPDKPNIFLARSTFSSIMETFGPVAKRLRSQRHSMSRIIIFCKNRLLCTQIYSFFHYFLRDEFTEPPGKNVETPEYRLVDMFTSGTHDVVKKRILASFANSDTPLRIVIATIAFGMGIEAVLVFIKSYMLVPQVMWKATFSTLGDLGGTVFLLVLFCCMAKV